MTSEDLMCPRWQSSPKPRFTQPISIAKAATSTFPHRAGRSRLCDACRARPPWYQRPKDRPVKWIESFRGPEKASRNELAFVAFVGLLFVKTIVTVSVVIAWL